MDRRLYQLVAVRTSGAMSSHLTASADRCSEVIATIITIVLVRGRRFSKGQAVHKSQQIFAPSRFGGYKDNTRSRQDKRVRKDGKKTNPPI